MKTLVGSCKKDGNPDFQPSDFGSPKQSQPCDFHGLNFGRTIVFFLRNIQPDVP